jgi:tRNA pseudouridine55 synthase
MTGILPVDKPAGPSSHDMVAVARRALGERRIGHTGTLDPFATGLLVLCVGTATRLAEYLVGLEKEYEATARLGVATDTLDHTGEVVAESDAWGGLDEAAIRASFESQAGTRLQTPPVFSAKKIAGRKAYELARAGEAVTPDPVEVTIHSLDVLAIDGADVRFRMRCSSGTYVRAVARDAGEALGVGAHLTALRRTAVGRFRVEDALAPDQLEDGAAVEGALVAPRDALRHLPALELSDADRDRIGHGQRLPAGDAPAGLLALVHEGELVAVAEVDRDAIRPRKVFT